MKTIFTLLFFVPVLCFSQSKGNTKIIATPSDTSNLFNRVVTYLYEQGYTLERKDETAGFLQTDKHRMKTNTFYKIKALVKGNTVIFSSLLNLPVIDNSFDEVHFTKGKTLDRVVWDITEEIAKHFGSVSYD